MKILEISNPVIVAGGIATKLLELEGKDLAEGLSRIYDGAVKDSQIDDSGLCAGLDDETMGEYAVLVDTFKWALERVKDLETGRGDTGFYTKAFVPLFANLAAWHKVLRDFRTLNDRSM